MQLLISRQSTGGRPSIYSIYIYEETSKIVGFRYPNLHSERNGGPLLNLWPTPRTTQHRRNSSCGTFPSTLRGDATSCGDWLAHKMIDCGSNSTGQCWSYCWLFVQLHRLQLGSISTMWAIRKHGSGVDTVSQAHGREGWSNFQPSHR